LNVASTSRVRSTQHVYAREFDGDLVLLDLAAGDYFALDEIGARLWSGVNSGRTVADITAELVKEYDVDASRLEADLLALLGDLLAKRLVEVVA